MFEIRRAAGRRLRFGQLAGWLLGIVLAAVFASVSVRDAAAVNPHAELLTANGITANTAGVRL